MTSPKPPKSYSPPKILQTLLHPIIIALHVGYRVYLKTIRKELVRFELFPENRPVEETALYVLWHSKSLLLIPYVAPAKIKYLSFFNFKHWFFQKMTGMQDEKRLIFTIPEETISNVVREMQKGYLVCMVGDGPYGPPGKLKPGAIAVAGRTNAPLITMRVEMEKSFRLPWRWDHYEIAWPFSKIKITALEYKIPVGEDFEVSRKKVQENLGNC